MAKNLRETIQALVQVPLNLEMFEQRRKKAKGSPAFLKPQRCSSIKDAAYMFKLEMQFSPSKLESLDISDKKWDTYEKIEAKKIIEEFQQNDSARKVLGDLNSGQQSIPFWKNCDNGNTLRSNFTASGMVQVCEPKKDSDDNLGLLRRLKIRQQVHLSMQGKITKLMVDDSTGSSFDERAGFSEKLACVKIERKQVSKHLINVRKLIAAAITKEWNEIINDFYEDLAAESRPKIDNEGSETQIRNEWLSHDEPEKRTQAATLLDLIHKYRKMKADS